MRAARALAVLALLMGAASTAGCVSFSCKYLNNCK